MISGPDWRAARNKPFAAYLRAARRGDRGLWRVVVVTVACLLAAPAVVVAIGADFPLRFDRDERGAAWLILTLTAIGAIWLVLAVLTPLFHRRSFLSLFAPSGAARSAAVAPGIFAGALLLIAILSIGLLPAIVDPFRYALAPKDLIDGYWWFALVGALAIFFQASAEELLFRGYLLQQLAVRFRSPWAWAVAPSALFGFMHFDASEPAADAAAYVFAATLFGLTAAYATWRTGGLGVAIGMHVAINLTALLGIDAFRDDLGALAMYEMARPTAAETVASEIALAVFIVAALEIPWSPLKRGLRLADWG